MFSSVSVSWFRQSMKENESKMRTINAMVFFVKVRDIFTVSSCKPYYTLYYDIELKEWPYDQVFIALSKIHSGYLDVSSNF